MTDEFKSAEIRVAAYGELTPEQGRALYAAYVKEKLIADEAARKLLTATDALENIAGCFSHSEGDIVDRERKALKSIQVGENDGKKAQETETAAGHRDDDHADNVSGSGHAQDEGHDGERPRPDGVHAGDAARLPSDKDSQASLTSKEVKQEK